MYCWTMNRLRWLSAVRDLIVFTEYRLILVDKQGSDWEESIL